MKVKENFVLRQIADTWVLMPLGDQNEQLNGMLTLSETGASIWKALEQGCDLDGVVAALTTEYAVTAEVAREGAVNFINRLIELGCIDAD